MVALNLKLCEELESRQFVALCYARYEPDSGELILADAGLPDPYLLRPGLAPEALVVTGPRLPLGLRQGEAYRTTPGVLAPGECLLLLTDGLPEAVTTGGEPLGYEELIALMPPLGPEPAAWLDAFFEAVRHATGTERTDDWTALLLERSPVAAVPR
jgi:serine phosphatase RsbU (regulator of sigma subunit)